MVTVVKPVRQMSMYEVTITVVTVGSGLAVVEAETVIDSEVTVGRLSPVDMTDPGRWVELTVERALLKVLEVPDPVCLDGVWEDGAPLEIVELGIGFLKPITVDVVLAPDFAARVDGLDGDFLMEERTPVAVDETAEFDGVCLPVVNRRDEVGLLGEIKLD